MMFFYTMAGERAPGESQEGGGRGEDTR